MWLSLLRGSPNIVFPNSPLVACVFLACFVPSYRFVACSWLDVSVQSPFSCRVVGPSPDTSVPSVSFPVSSCVDRPLSPSRPCRCPFPTIVFARFAPFPVPLCAICPSFLPRPFRFPVLWCFGLPPALFYPLLVFLLVSRCLEAR